MELITKYLINLFHLVNELDVVAIISRNVRTLVYECTSRIEVHTNIKAPVRWYVSSYRRLRQFVVEVRPIGNAAERYKAILGDGLFSVPCVISRQVSENVSRWLHSGTVIDTNEFMISMIEQRK